MDNERHAIDSTRKRVLIVDDDRPVNIGTIGHVDHGKTTLTAAIVMALAGSASWDAPFAIAGRNRRSFDTAATPLKAQKVDLKTEHDYARIDKAERTRQRRNEKRLKDLRR